MTKKTKISQNPAVIIGNMIIIQISIITDLHFEVILNSITMMLITTTAEQQQWK